MGSGPGRRAGRRGSSLARVVAVSGLVSAAALVYAALALAPDPTAAGRAAQDRIATEVAATVETEWQRHRRAEPPGIRALESPLSWVVGEMEPSPESQPRPVDDGEPEALSADAVGALLDEAARVERLDGDDEAALELVLEAVGLGAEPGRRGRARLRAIQLAGRLADAETVRAQWSAILGELDGAETEHGVSLLLQCGLAAAPHLGVAERETLVDVLLQAWFARRLALPGDPPRIVLDPTAPDVGQLSWGPRRGALWSRLVEIAEPLLARPGAVLDPPLAMTPEGVGRSLRVAALYRELGEESAPPVLPDRWSVQRVGDLALRWTTRRDQVHASLHRIDTVVDAFVDHLRAADALPPGFTVRNLMAGRYGDPGAAEFERMITSLAKGRPAISPAGSWNPPPGTGSVDSSGPRRTLARIPLAELGLTLSLLHDDPGQLVEAEIDRLRLGRYALLFLALLTAGATLATTRALSRERALAEARAAFVASVSHELRTPVSSILLMAENLEADRVGEASRGRYHRLIRREALRLRRLVDDVLDFSRLERGRAPSLHTDEVDPAAFVDALASEVAAQVESAGATFHFTHGELPEAATLDAEAVRRAVLNLVDNALRHSGSDEIALLADPGPASGWRLAVADRGRGVPLAQHESIFEPFRRLATAEGTTGAGLGLAIVREIARGHGGEVTVSDRDDGPGAIFTLHLPAAGLRVTPAEAQDHPAAGAAAGTTPHVDPPGIDPATKPRP